VEDDDEEERKISEEEWAFYLQTDLSTEEEGAWLSSFLFGRYIPAGSFLSRDFSTAPLPSRQVPG
jgi:hypothetical protein